MVPLGPTSGVAYRRTLLRSKSRTPAPGADSYGPGPSMGSEIRLSKSPYRLNATSSADALWPDGHASFVVQLGEAVVGPLAGTNFRSPGWNFFGPGLPARPACGVTAWPLVVGPTLPSVALLPPDEDSSQALSSMMTTPRVPATATARRSRSLRRCALFIIRPRCRTAGMDGNATGGASNITRTSGDNWQNDPQLGGTVIRSGR